MDLGGNAVYYWQELSFDTKNGIALVSYQGEGTPGRKLLETGKILTRGHDMKVTAEVKYHIKMAKMRTPAALLNECEMFYLLAGTILGIFTFGTIA